MKNRIILVFVICFVVSISGFTQTFQQVKPRTIKMLKLLKPNGGEKLTIGLPYKITWQAAGLKNNVKLSLWRNGSRIAGIKKDLSPGIGYFEWKAGSHDTGIAEPGSGYTIKIMEQGGDDSKAADSSDFPFTLQKLVFQKVKPPVIAIMKGDIIIDKPSAASFWDPGEQHDIVWNNTFTKNQETRIDLYDYNGKTFLQNIATVKLNDSGTTSKYAWTIPDIGPKKCRVKIFTPNGSEGESQMFTIRVKTQTKKYKVYATTVNKYKYYWWKGDSGSFSVGYNAVDDPGPGKMRLGYQNHWTSSYGGQYYGFAYRSFLSFNMAPYMGKGLVLKATLHYTVFMGNNCGIRVYQVNKAWTNPFSVDADLTNENVTTTVHNWMASASNNHGLMLTGTNEGVLTKQVQKNNTNCVCFADNVYIELEILEKQ